MLHDSALRSFGQHVFCEADQQSFARLSGDVNPMHMDATTARRLLTGRPVVHGIHTLLVALERWPNKLPALQWRIECDFVNPVSVGESVVFTGGHDDDGRPLLVAVVDRLPCTRIIVTSPRQPRSGLVETGAAEKLQMPREPIARAPASWLNRQQVLPLPAAAMHEAFPGLCGQLGGRRVAAIALLSAYVGMVCPGLNSLFSSVVIEPGDDAGDLRFEVLKFDSRFNLFVIAFDGCVRGEIKAFLRAPQQPQPATADLLPQLVANEFCATHTWVIGGSRGLGELASKLVAAGGGRVTLTFAAGAADAARVVQDINASGRGQAAMRRIDLTEGGFDNWMNDIDFPDAVLYFATPRIFRKKAGTFNAALFEEFIAFYVRYFDTLCSALERMAGERTVRVFYPSTVFIEERPKGMTEYTMAKAAAEVLIADFGRTLRQVQIVSRRLPRLATDQTASIFEPPRGSNIDVILPIMRELLARSAAG